MADPISVVASTTAWLVGAGAFVGDFIQMSRMRIFWLRGVGGAGKSRIQMRCGIEKQPPTVFTFFYTPGFDDRVSTENKEFDARSCPFPGRGACPMDIQALLSHVESHLNMLPAATNESFGLLRKELCSLQEVVHSVEETMREYRSNECKDRNGIEDLLKRLHIALNELRDTEMHGRSSGQMPHYTRYDEGTYMEGQQSSPYEPLQSLRRCIAKAIERARVKIKSSTRCDSEWHTLEKYSPSVSYTQPSLGKGAQSVIHNESFCRHFEQTSGRDLRVFELSCLIMGKTMCPLLQWLFLQSLKAEPPSILDRSLLNLIPSLSQIVTTLGRHHTITLSMCLVSTSLTALALFIPLSHISESCRPPVLFCCCLALVASGPLWTYIGGSAASYFLIFMPYTMSVGISLGLLWYWCVTERECRIGVTQDELQREASFSKVAEPS